MPFWQNSISQEWHTRATWKHLGAFTSPGRRWTKCPALGECIQHSPGFKTTQDLRFLALLLGTQLINEWPAVPFVGITLWRMMCPFANPFWEKQKISTGAVLAWKPGIKEEQFCTSARNINTASYSAKSLLSCASLLFKKCKWSWKFLGEA